MYDTWSIWDYRLLLLTKTTSVRFCFNQYSIVTCREKNRFREDAHPLNHKRMFVAQSAKGKLVWSLFSLGFTGNSGDRLGFFDLKKRYTPEKLKMDPCKRREILLETMIFWVNVGFKGCNTVQPQLVHSLPLFLNSLSDFGPWKNRFFQRHFSYQICVIPKSLFRWSPAWLS